MATFFGTVQGGRGKATRLGDKTHGLCVSAQSYAGSVIVNLYYNNVDQIECVDISVAPGSTSDSGRSLYAGPIKGLFSDQVYLGR